MDTQAERKIVDSLIRSMKDHPEKWSRDLPNTTGFLYYNRGQKDELTLWQHTTSDTPAYIDRPQEYRFIEKSCQRDITTAVKELRNQLDSQQHEKLKNHILDILGSDIREERLRKLNELERKEKKPLWKRLFNL